MPGWPPPADWPHRDRSERISVAPHDWHVQILGEGPDLLLIHGSGGATHSWRGVMPILALRHRVIAVDLPGQGFTRVGRPRFSLDAMAADLWALVRSQGWDPAAIVGHSAGAAVALRMALDAPRPPGRIVGVNAALGSFEGAAGIVFPAIARTLVANPLTGFAVSRFASEAATRRMLGSMGSRIDAEGLGHYARLFASPGHVQATLRMMASWELAPLRRRLPEIARPVLLIVGEEDRAVPPSVSEAAASRLPDARVERLPGGHLVHEERPEETAAAIEAHLL
jgi:magnesium chelatase accessory protein